MREARQTEEQIGRELSQQIVSQNQRHDVTKQIQLRQTQQLESMEVEPRNAETQTVTHNSYTSRTQAIAIPIRPIFVFFQSTISFKHR
jgi:hypothetical protein